MSIIQIETVPARFAQFSRNGFEGGFRLPLFGFVFSAGWAWREDQPYCLFGFDMPFGTIKYYNGPRLLQAGSVLGFLRLRVGFDFMLFVGKRDPKIQKQIDASQNRFREAMKDHFDEIAAHEGAGAIVDSGTEVS